MTTQEIIEQLRHSEEISRTLMQNSQMRKDFEEVLEIFVAANRGEGFEENTLLCSIHDSFPSHHSCIACNLQENARLVEKFLLYPELLHSVDYACTTLLLLLYLLVERINTYLELGKIPDSYRSRHFQVFQEVKQWANFLKHPKSFMLVTHPMWEYQGMEDAQAHQLSNKSVIINSAFVKEFYSGEQNNSKLYKALARKDEVLVLFPNPTDLMHRFTRALQKFVAVIAENEIVRELLESEVMIKEHFVPEAEQPQ